MGKRTGNIRRNRPDRRYYDRREDGERRQAPVDRKTKVLVTGDRWWDDISTVVEALGCFNPEKTILVHGACHGADTICAAVAEALGFEVRPYPADWTKYKKAAGPIRNQEMLDKEHRPEEPIDVCLAFHNDISNSRGTRNMLSKVDKAGIPWKLHTSHAIQNEEHREHGRTSGSSGSPVEGI